MTPEEQNKTLDAWQTSARYWDKYRVLIAQMFAPLTSGLVEEARIGIGQKVLDISGGSGEPSLTISRIVGPTGSGMYTDPVAGMVETTQEEAGRRGLTNIHFRQCSADDLPFADRTFDTAVGGLSAMVFVDPVAAMRGALRVIRQDGYVSFVVWGGLAPAQLTSNKAGCYRCGAEILCRGNNEFPAQALIVSGRKAAV